jgi:ABC-type multidrug transport system fused ATPase/permease subunit
MQDLADEIDEKPFDSALTRRLFTYVRPYRQAFLLAALLLLCIDLAELSGPWLIKRIIDEHVLKGLPEGMGPLAALYLLSVLGQGLLQVWQTIQTKRMGQDIMLDLRREIFSKIHSQSMRYFDKNPVGSLMTRVIYDVETLNQFFTSLVSAIFQDFFMLLSAGCILIYWDWRLGLLSMSLLPLLAWCMLVFRRQARENYRQVRANTSKMNAFLSENLSGMSSIQLFSREAKNAKKFDAINRDSLEILIKQINIGAFFLPFADFLSALAIGMALVYGGHRVLQATLPLGTVVATILYIKRFFEPLRDLSEKFNILQSAMASSERIFALLDRKEELGDPAQPVSQGALRGAIEFKNVGFAYEEDAGKGPRWVLKDLSFSLRPGERVAVVGPTGAGKTSLINVLYRFYPMQEGQILLDGVPIHAMRRTDFRRKMSLVPQDPFLFSGSLLENLRLSDASIAREKIEWACRQTKAHDFIAKLPGTYEFELKEGGANLSTGQKQLLAFARALVFDPAVLVLDEATASVDTQTEREIQEALEVLLRGRTSLTVAHRLTTVMHSDRILVIKDGQLAEQGSHEELMKQNGIYRSLIELQFKEVA